MIKDTRDKLWKEIEESIQKKALMKDKKFRLTGKWKKFLRFQDGFKVYSVDGKWIRNNLSCYFGHGGHGYVHEFIPLDEVWISTEHYNEGRFSLNSCSCKTKRKKVSKNYFESTLIHEIEECQQMKKGKNYWVSHNIALDKERKVGLLDDPFED